MADPIRDRITITLDELREHLRDYDLSDSYGERLLDAAADRAQEYVGHDFSRPHPTNPNLPDIEDPIPATIEAGILRIAASLYEWRDEETRNERLGDESKQRSVIMGGAEVYLWPHRKLPGL